MVKVIIFNGPPNSGKDAACDVVQMALTTTERPIIELKFKTKLYQLTAEVHSIPFHDFVHMATDRELKELPDPTLDGLSPRQAMIKMSEVCIKPVYGNQYFGRAVARDIKFIRKTMNAAIVCSDGGFASELEPILTDIENVDLHVVRVHRPNCSYAGDSRSYLTHSMFPEEFASKITFHDIDNTSTLEDYERAVVALSKEIITGTA